MTFAPEWVDGNPNLRTDNALYLWVYLARNPKSDATQPSAAGGPA